MTDVTSLAPIVFLALCVGAVAHGWWEYHVRENTALGVALGIMGIVGVVLTMAQIIR